MLYKCIHGIFFMANTSRKIEKLGLADRVIELKKAGRTAKDISVILTDESGQKITPSAVCRYLADVKEQLEPDAIAKVREHIEKTIESDLSQLEEVQGLTLKIARDSELTTAERCAEAAVKIPGEISTWLGWLDDANIPELRGKVVQQVIQRAVELVAMDTKKMELVLKAIKEFSNILNTKFRNGDFLQASEDTGIHIYCSESDKSSETLPDGSKRVVFFK